MAILRAISIHIRSIGQKLTADNIHNFGQKAMNTATVMSLDEKSVIRYIKSRTLEVKRFLLFRQ